MPAQSCVHIFQHKWPTVQLQAFSFLIPSPLPCSLLLCNHGIASYSGNSMWVPVAQAISMLTHFWFPNRPDHDITPKGLGLSTLRWYIYAPWWAIARDFGVPHNREQSRGCWWKPHCVQRSRIMEDHISKKKLVLFLLIPFLPPK